MSSPQRIAIIGGGWAGLAVAIELCQHGHAVSVYESSPQLGGRARSIEWNGMTLDNGQHLVIGAYQQLLSLLNTMQADIGKLFKRLPHHMLMLDARTADTLFELKLPTFPAPLHLLFGVLKIPQLSLLEKFQLLLRFNKLLNTPLIKDTNVSNWLAGAGLPKAYTEYLLKPVCLAALTTHPEQASARALQSVLLQTFNAPADHTDLLIPAQDLGRTFPELARQFIEQQGGKLFTRSKVQALQFTRSGVSGIVVNDEPIAFDQVILATPPSATARLLENHSQFTKLCTTLQQLQYEPVTTLYLQFARPVKLAVPMIGVINGLSEWVFERATSGHANLLAVVISAQGEHLTMPPAELSAKIHSELKHIIPGLPELLDSKLIVEKRATIQCSPGVDKFRPGIQTEVSNLKLCGDYVYIEENNQPGLPSTLEGALRSGVKCAQLIIQQSNPKG